jgi:hypothetical protein
MPLYRFRILDKSNRVVAGQGSICKNDDAAREHAELLATRVRDTDQIEIWHDQRQVIRKRTPDADEEKAKPRASGRRPHRPKRSKSDRRGRQ